MLAKKYYYPILFLIYITWTLIGVFPLTCYESDSMHIIAGCDMMNQNGWTFPPVYSYQYDMQPLITYVILVVKEIMPFMTCEEIYCLLTAIAAILLSTITIELVHRLINIKKSWILLGLFLLPESVAIAMYPNSAVFASLFFVWGLWSIINNRPLYESILSIGIAPLFRIDILIIYPVIIFIFLWKRIGLKRSFVQTLIVAICTIVIISLGCLLLQANPFRSYLSYNSFNDTLAYSSLVIYAILAFYTILNIVFVPLGLILLSKNKEYKLITIAIMPIILLHIMFRHTGCAAKHYLYLIPFILILVVPVLFHIYNKYAKHTKCIFTGCLLLFLTISIRIVLPQYEWIERPGAAGKAGPLFIFIQEDKSPYKVSFGIGTGQLIPTADEYMLASGNLFYPFYIHRFKTNLINNKENVERILPLKDNYNLLIFSWQDEYHFHTQLIKKGFNIKRENNTEKPTKTHYYKKGQHITLYFDQIGEKDIKRLNESISRHTNKDCETYIITTRCDRTTSGMEALLAEGNIERLAERIYRIK